MCVSGDGVAAITTRLERANETEETVAEMGRAHQAGYKSVFFSIHLWRSYLEKHGVKECIQLCKFKT